MNCASSGKQTWCRDKKVAGKMKGASGTEFCDITESESLCEHSADPALSSNSEFTENTHSACAKHIFPRHAKKTLTKPEDRQDTVSSTMEPDNFDETWNSLVLRLVEITDSDLVELIQVLSSLDPEECAPSTSAGTSSAGTSSAGTFSAGTSSAGTSSAGTSSAGTSSEVEQKVRQYMENIFAPHMLTDQNWDLDNADISFAVTCKEEEKDMPAATALSPSDTTEITDKIIVIKAQMTDEKIWTEPVRTPESTKTSGKSLYNRLIGCLRRRSKKGSEQHEARPSKEDLSSTSLNVIGEQEDSIEKLSTSEVDEVLTPHSSQTSEAQITQDSPTEGEKDFLKTETLDTLLKSPPTEDEENVDRTDIYTSESPPFPDTLEKNKEEPMTGLPTKSASSSHVTRNSFFKSMKKVWKKRPGKKQRTKHAAKCQKDNTAKEKSVSPKYNTMCSPLKGQGEQDEAFSVYQLFAADKEIYSPPGTPEDEPTEDKNEPSHVLTPVIKRFFHCLTEEQWRELGEGVYNKDVKEKLVDMCLEMLRFSTNSVIKITQSFPSSSPTSDTCDHNKTLTSEDLKEFFSCNIQSLVENSFSQPVCEVLGANTPVRVSPEFTEAMAAEVLHEVNSVPSDAIQASVDGGSCSTTAPGRGSPSEKTLAGAIQTMKSFLTGRANAAKRRIVAQKDRDTKNGNYEDMTPSTKSKTPEEKIGKGLWGCICNIFTKDKKKEKTDKKEQKKKMSWTKRLLCF